MSRGPYLVGDSFTAADLYLGAQLGFGLQFGMIEKRPAFVEYVGTPQRPPGRGAREGDRRRTGTVAPPAS